MTTSLEKLGALVEALNAHLSFLLTVLVPFAGRAPPAMGNVACWQCGKSLAHRRFCGRRPQNMAGDALAGARAEPQERHDGNGGE